MCEVLLTILGVCLASVAGLCVFVLRISQVPMGTVAVLERLGRFHSVLHPGFHLVFPLIDTLKTVHWTRIEESRMGGRNTVARVKHTLSRIPTNEQVHDLPPYSVVTKDRIQLQVNAIVFFKIVDVKKAVYGVNDLYSSISSQIETAVCAFASSTDFEEIYTSRDKMMASVLTELRAIEEDWGVKITRFDIQEIQCSENLRQATEKAAIERRETESRIALIQAKKRTEIEEQRARTELELQKQKNALEIAHMELQARKEREIFQSQLELDLLKTNIQKQTLQLQHDCEALTQRYQAEAQGLKSLLQVPGLTSDYLHYRSLQQGWKELASSQNAKIIMPFDAMKFRSSPILSSEVDQ